MWHSFTSMHKSKPGRFWHKYDVYVTEYNRYHLKFFQQTLHQTPGWLNRNKHFLTLKDPWQINAHTGQMGRIWKELRVWNFGSILVDKMLQKLPLTKSVIKITCAPDFTFFNGKLKVNFCHLQGQIHNWALICQRPFKLRKCLFPFKKPRVWCGSYWKNSKWYLMYKHQKKKFCCIPSFYMRCIRPCIWLDPTSTN